MAYTSEQYKYLLFRRLQRHLAMEEAAERAYTQSFFGKLFDETVTITEEAYDNFNKLMDDEIQFCADNNIYYASDISESMINEHKLLLVEAFAAIGIDLVIDVVKTTSGNTTFTSGGDATFTKPNGEVMVYSVRSGTNEFLVYSRARSEYNYAKLSEKYYNFKDTEPPSLYEYNPMRAGPNTFWSYSADTTTMTITGNGTYVAAPTNPQVGGGTFDTLILGANVSRIYAGALSAITLRTVVLLHAADAALLLDEGIIKSNNSWTLDIYCDNESFRNYKSFPAGLIINWHSLDDWDGGASDPTDEGVYYNGAFVPEFRNPYPTRSYVLLGQKSDGTYVMHPYSSARTMAADATTLIAYGYTIYNLFLEDGTWYWTAKRDSATVTPIWANYDILNEDGTVFLKASAPVKNGVPLGIVAYSYKGAILPATPDRDKSVYLYTTMFCENGVYYLQCSDAKAVSSSGTLAANVTYTLSGKTLLYKASEGDTEWTFVDSYDNYSKVVTKDNMQWSDYVLQYNYVDDSGTASTSTQVSSTQLVPANIYG